jgi:hypothetical protein
MDNERFDQLSRSLATETTRRGVLRGLVLSALSAGTVLSPAGAEAAPKPPKCLPAGSKCNSGSGSPNSKCCDNAVCCGNKCCGSVAGQPDICINGSCCAYLRTCGTLCCPTGTAPCNCGTSPKCSDISTDRENCGTCGHRCPDGALCDDGNCVCLQDMGARILCEGQCIDPLTDNNHCGGCPGVSCDTQAGEMCCEGACIEPQLNREHCGGCPGTNCGAGDCCNGQCLTPCLPGAVRDENCNCVCLTGVPCTTECCPADYFCKPNYQTGVPECCPPNRTNGNIAFCCPPNRVACGAVCCGDVGWICCPDVAYCAPSLADCPT